jgi:hypothetical protein
MQIKEEVKIIKKISLTEEEMSILGQASKIIDEIYNEISQKNIMKSDNSLSAKVIMFNDLNRTQATLTLLNKSNYWEIKDNL